MHLRLYGCAGGKDDETGRALRLDRHAPDNLPRSMGMDRRQAMWEASALSDRPMGAFKGHQSGVADFERVRWSMLDSMKMAKSLLVTKALHKTKGPDVIDSKPVR